jgi:hypothetical protein
MQRIYLNKQRKRKKNTQNKNMDNAINKKKHNPTKKILTSQRGGLKLNNSTFPHLHMG